jgi:hypothetical protein
VLVRYLPRPGYFAQTEGRANQILERLAIGKNTTAPDEAVGKRHVARRVLL